MGQAKTDLPDPLEQLPPDASAPRVDDLLAQMAGDEIDRLLAEADTAPGAALTQSAPGPLAEPESVDEVPAAPAAIPEAAPPKSAADLDDQTAAQLDDLFRQLTAETPPAPAEATDAPAAQASSAEHERAEIPAQRAASAAAPPSPAPAAPSKPVPAAAEQANDGEISRQLDELFQQLSDSPPAAEATDAPAAQASAAEDDKAEIPAQRKASAEAAQKPAAVPAPPEQAAARKPTPAAAEQANDGEVSRQLDELFQQLSASPLPPTEGMPTETAAPPAEPLTATASADPDPEKQTSELKRQVLSADALSAAAALPEPPAAISATAPREHDPNYLPLYLRPLEWLNAPLAACSDHTRDVIAKIAVLTLVNALALLAYVLFVRHA